jgi:hypothetical protein
LEIDIDMPCPPHAPVDWDRAPLAHLAGLRHLGLRVGYASKGFEGAMGLLGAPPALATATVGARHACFCTDDTEESGDGDSDSDDHDELELKSWDIDPRVARALADRPACHVGIENLPVTLCHPRLAVVRRRP